MQLTKVMSINAISHRISNFIEWSFSSFTSFKASGYLDAILSINNYHANLAAVAEYPAITVPMGYNEKGKPKGLTFIAGRLQEKQLLSWAYVFEQASKSRKTPKNYDICIKYTEMFGRTVFIILKLWKVK